MAYIGLAYPIIAKLGTDNTTYTDGFILGEAVNTNLDIEYNEAKLYGDNRQTEYVKEFKNGKVTLGITSIPNEAHGILFGHTVDKETEEGVTIITDKTDDQPNYVGVGLIKAEIVNGVRSYIASWYYKVLFTETGESADTKGENFVFQTPSLEGLILSLPNKDWRERRVFKTEDEAYEYVKEKAGIV